MTNIPLFYEIPIFAFVALALFTIYKLNKVKTYIAEGVLKQSFLWIVVTSIFFTLWGIVHIIGDFFSPNKVVESFIHFGVSHTFLLISMICLAISAHKIENAYRELEGKLGFGKKKK